MVFAVLRWHGVASGFEDAAAYGRDQASEENNGCGIALDDLVEGASACGIRGVEISRETEEHQLQRADREHQKSGKDCDMQDANLSGACLYEAKISNTNMQGAGLANVDLHNCHFQIVNLDHADLSHASFASIAHLLATQPAISHFEDINLKRVNLSSAEIIKVDLSHTDFQYANLESATLQEANLEFSNFEEANLSGVNLKGACLKHANLHNADLCKAIYDEYTQLPDDISPDTAGMIVSSQRSTP